MYRGIGLRVCAGMDWSQARVPYSKVVEREKNRNYPVIGMLVESCQ